MDENLAKAALEKINAQRVEIAQLQAALSQALSIIEGTTPTTMSRTEFSAVAKALLHGGAEYTQEGVDRDGPEAAARLAKQVVPRMFLRDETTAKARKLRPDGTAI